MSKIRYYLFKIPVVLIMSAIFHFVFKRYGLEAILPITLSLIIFSIVEIKEHIDL